MNRKEQIECLRACKSYDILFSMAVKLIDLNLATQELECMKLRAKLEKYHEK